MRPPGYLHCIRTRVSGCSPQPRPAILPDVLLASRNADDSVWMALHRPPTSRNSDLGQVGFAPRSI